MFDGNNIKSIDIHSHQNLDAINAGILVSLVRIMEKQMALNGKNRAV
jgi:hypothetical protein